MKPSLPTLSIGTLSEFAEPPWQLALTCNLRQCRNVCCALYMLSSTGHGSRLLAASCSQAICTSSAADKRRCSYGASNWIRSCNTLAACSCRFAAGKWAATRPMLLMHRGRDSGSSPVTGCSHLANAEACNKLRNISAETCHCNGMPVNHKAIPTMLLHQQQLKSCTRLCTLFPQNMLDVSCTSAIPSAELL